jgi:ribosomal protein L39E
MSSNKDEELKQFLISARKKIGPGLTNAPVWVLQKAGRRIWNPKQHRNWRETSLGKEFRKRKERQQ